ncbi:hypothetical protein FRC12_004066 [Ceratobasidium sp. 428]|nr:hypothetical protein FRC12_004066 [Ceratobasidium sp. 428]
MTTPTAENTEVNIHPNFCFRDASLFYQVGNVIFGIHHSTVSQNVHSIRGQPGDPISCMTLPEGSNLGLALLSPYIVPAESGISPADFEYFLKFIYSTDFKLWMNPSLEAAIAVLHLSHKLCCPTGTEYAIAMLTRKSPDSAEPIMRPALQIFLGRTYAVSEWLQPAFETIMYAPIAKLTREDMYALGTETYRIIVLGKEAAYQKRLNLVSHPIKLIHSPDCLKAKHQRGCEAGHHTAYDRLKSEILGTVPPAGFPRALTVIGHLLKPEDLGLLDDSCATLTLGAMKDSNAFDVERVIINKVINDKLLLLSPAYYGSLELPLAPLYMAN